MWGDVVCCHVRDRKDRSCDAMSVLYCVVVCFKYIRRQSYTARLLLNSVQFDAVKISKTINILIRMKGCGGSRERWNR